MKKKRISNLNPLPVTSPIPTSHIPFVDPTGRAIRADDGNPMFINDSKFAAFMYARESILQAFRHGEFKPFGYETWEQVKEHLQPARLATAVMQFINKPLPETQDSLTDLYASPISQEFPELKPFFCIGDGHTYSGNDLPNWFLKTLISPINQSRVDIANDLISDPIAEKILEGHKQGIRDLKKIFNQWRQPSAVVADFKRKPISIGFENILLITLLSLFTVWVSWRYSERAFSYQDVACLFFLTVEKLRKTYRVSTLFNTGNKNSDFGMLSIIMSASVALELVKQMSLKNLDFFATVIIGIVQQLPQLFWNLPHIVAWILICSCRPEILADIRTITKNLMRDNNKALTILKASGLLSGAIALIGFSSRFPDSLSIKSLANFDVASCSLIIAPTYALPMLDYTARKITGPYMRLSLRPDNIRSVLTKSFWPLVIAIAAFFYTLRETNNPLCAFSTALAMVFSVNLDNSVKKYAPPQRVTLSHHPYVLMTRETEQKTRGASDSRNGVTLTQIK